jgi:hypothetical protein
LTLEAEAAVNAEASSRDIVENTLPPVATEQQLRIWDFEAFLKEPIAHPITKELDQGLGWTEVLEMLMIILPKQSAQVSHRIQSSRQDNDWNKILWYNKSRETSRICPTCLRLYSVGDELAAHVSGGLTAEDLSSLDRNNLLEAQQREQESSGFCMSTLSGNRE